MNTTNFEKQIDKTILQRGLAYYQSGQVTYLAYDPEEHAWGAEVRGSDDYLVMICVDDDGDFEDMGCDCPYEHGDYCKHVAAVLYAIKDQNKVGARKAKHSKQSKQKLAPVLDKLDKPTLVTLVLELTKRDKGLKEELLLRYGEEDNAVETARAMIQAALELESSRHHPYMDEMNVSRGVEAADKVLKMVDDKIATKEVSAAVSLLAVILEELSGLLDYPDEDVLDDIYILMDDTMERLEAIVAVAEVNEADAETVFDVVMNYMQSPTYSSWTGWREDLKTVLVPFCKYVSLRGKLELHIFEPENRRPSPFDRSDYMKGQKQGLQLEIIRRFDGEQAAVAYMEQCFENNTFKRMLIQMAIDKKQYDRALKFCEEAEWEADPRGREIKEWKQFRHKIYTATGDIEGQKVISLELLADDFDFFVTYKSLYTEDEWPEALKIALSKFDDKHRHEPYLTVLVHEKLKHQLWERCRESTSLIIRYYEHLLPDYSVEIGDKLLEMVTTSAARANTRNDYKNVCGLLKHYKNVSGKQKADAVREGLKRTYARRPAFLDELSKIKL